MESRRDKDKGEKEEALEVIMLTRAGMVDVFVLNGDGDGNGNGDGDGDGDESGNIWIFGGCVVFGVNGDRVEGEPRMSLGRDEDGKHCKIKCSCTHVSFTHVIWCCCLASLPSPPLSTCTQR